MATIKIENAPREIINAIAAGNFYDDTGRDVREIGQIGAFDHKGNPDDHADIYRLWPAVDAECVGLRFEVYADRVVVGSVSSVDGETV